MLNRRSTSLLATQHSHGYAPGTHETEQHKTQLTNHDTDELIGVESPVNCSSSMADDNSALYDAYRVPEPFETSMDATKKTEEEEEEQVLLWSKLAVARAEALLRQVAQGSADGEYDKLPAEHGSVLYCATTGTNNTDSDAMLQPHVKHYKAVGHPTNYTGSDEECGSDNASSEEEEDDEFARAMAQADEAMHTAAECLQRVRDTRLVDSVTDAELTARLAELLSEDDSGQSAHYADYLLHTNPLSLPAHGMAYVVRQQPNEDNSITRTTSSATLTRTDGTTNHMTNVDGTEDDHVEDTGIDEKRMWCEARARAAELRQFLHTLQAKCSESTKEDDAIATPGADDAAVSETASAHADEYNEADCNSLRTTGVSSALVLCPAPQTADTAQLPITPRSSLSVQPSTCRTIELGVLYAYEQSPSREEMAQLRAWDGVVTKQQQQRAQQFLAESAMNANKADTPLQLQSPRTCTTDSLSFTEAACANTADTRTPCASTTLPASDTTLDAAHDAMNGASNVSVAAKKENNATEQACENIDGIDILPYNDIDADSDDDCQDDERSVMERIVAELLPSMSEQISKSIFIPRLSSGHGRSGSSMSNSAVVDVNYSDEKDARFRRRSNRQPALSSSSVSRHAGRTLFRLQCEEQEGQAMRQAERYCIACMAVDDCLRRCNSTRQDILLEEQQSWKGLCERMGAESTQLDYQMLWRHYDVIGRQMQQCEAEERTTVRGEFDRAGACVRRRDVARALLHRLLDSSACYFDVTTTSAEQQTRKSISEETVSTDQRTDFCRTKIWSRWAALVQMHDDIQRWSASAAVRRGVAAALCALEEEDEEDCRAETNPARGKVGVAAKGKQSVAAVRNMQATRAMPTQPSVSHAKSTQVTEARSSLTGLNVHEKEVVVLHRDWLYRWIVQYGKKLFATGAARDRPVGAITNLSLAREGLTRIDWDSLSQLCLSAPADSSETIHCLPTEVSLSSHGIRHLDLSDNALRQVDVSALVQTFPHVSTVALRHCSLTALTNQGHSATTTTTAAAPANQTLLSSSPAMRTTRIRSVAAVHASARKVWLAQLDVSDNALHDLSAVGQVLSQSLTTLIARANVLQSVSGLTGCRRLGCLYLAHNALRTISIDTTDKGAIINMRSNTHSDTSSSQAVPDTRYHHMQQGDGNDEALVTSTMPLLTELDVCHNQLTKVDGLADHNLLLNTLALSHNPLRTFPSASPVATPPPSATLGRPVFLFLAQLYLNHTGLRTLRAGEMPSMPMLSVLHAEGNALCEVTGLVHCPRLTQLRLGQNALATWDALSPVLLCSLLTSLDVSHNPVMCTATEVKSSAADTAVTSTAAATEYTGTGAHAVARDEVVPSDEVTRRLVRGLPCLTEVNGAVVRTCKKLLPLQFIYPSPVSHGFTWCDASRHTNASAGSNSNETSTILQTEALEVWNGARAYAHTFAVLCSDAFFAQLRFSLEQHAIARAQQRWRAVSAATTTAAEQAVVDAHTEPSGNAASSASTSVDKSFCATAVISSCTCTGSSACDDYPDQYRAEMEMEDDMWAAERRALLRSALHRCTDTHFDSPSERYANVHQRCAVYALHARLSARNRARLTLAYWLQHRWRRYSRRMARYSAAARVIQPRWRGAVVRHRLQCARWGCVEHDMDEEMFVKVDESSWQQQAEDYNNNASNAYPDVGAGLRPLLQKVMAGRAPEPQLCVAALPALDGAPERVSLTRRTENDVPPTNTQTEAAAPTTTDALAEVVTDAEKDEQPIEQRSGGGEWGDYGAALAVRLAKKNRKLRQVHEQYIKDTFVKDPLQARRLRGTR